MNYAALRTADLPIGSGNTEATCKTVVEFRAKARRLALDHRYRPSHIQFRALATSDGWGEAMELTLRPLRKAA